MRLILQCGFEGVFRSRSRKFYRGDKQHGSLYSNCIATIRYVVMILITCKEEYWIYPNLDFHSESLCGVIILTANIVCFLMVRMPRKVYPYILLRNLLVKRELTRSKISLL